MHHPAEVKLTIYHLGTLIKIDPALSGEALERRRETETFEVTDRARIDETLAHIERARPEPADVVCDARWGLVYADASGARVRSLYLDAFGTRGELDGVRVRLADDSLVLWLRQLYGADFVLS